MIASLTLAMTQSNTCRIAKVSYDSKHSHVESNNNIGTIYVERVDATNSSGTLTYTTGISGTKGVEVKDADGKVTDPNDTQDIIVNTNSATLNINGAGGVDKFNIEASSFTKTLTIAGNLGTVPNTEANVGNYDSVRIDLSKTSGVDLNISNLIVSNPDDAGIQITASKGQDNITLVAGANHDVIEFAAGGGRTAVAEEYTVDLGNLRLGKNQSFTIDGLTITNIKATAAILTAQDIADIIEKYALAAGAPTANATFSLATASGSFSTTAKISDYVAFSGKLESLTGAWATAGGTITAAHTSGQTTFTFTTPTNGNVSDLNLAFGGNSNAAVPNSFKAEYTKARSAGFAMVQGASASGGSVSEIVLSSAKGDSVSTFLTFSINGENHSIKVVDTGTANSVTATATALTKAVLQILSGASATAAAALSAVEFYIDGGSAKVTTTTKTDAFSLGSDWVWAQGADSTKLTIANSNPFATGDAQHVIINQIGGSTDAFVDFSLLPDTTNTGDTQGQIVIDFGSGLLAGQSYTFNGKSVVATKDLTGAEVAEAFTVANGGGFEGAVIVGNWAASTIADAKVLYGIDGSKLTILDNTGSAFGTALETDITGTGALAVNTNKVSGTTTKQGAGTGDTTFADSYVVFSSEALGSAGAGSAAGVAANIKAVTSAMDTITNFDVANDKLLLSKLSGSTFVANDRFGAASAATDTGIYVDTAGNTISYTVANGIFSFSAGNAEASAMTLDQKLFAVSKAMSATDKIAGFADGGDFYVVATGGTAGSTTDDLVIKLAVVTGITDIATILG